jgi:hypothetical protein
MNTKQKNSTKQDVFVVVNDDVDVDGWSLGFLLLAGLDCRLEEF